MRFPLLAMVASLLLANCASAQVPISGLPAATTPLTGSELSVIVQGGVTKRTTTSAIGTSGGTVVNTGTGLQGGPCTSAAACTVSINPAQTPQLGSANTFTATQTYTNGIIANGTFSFNGTFGLVGNFNSSGAVTAAGGFGGNCTPTSSVPNCLFQGIYSSPSSTGGSALQVFHFDSSNNTAAHYGINAFVDFMPTAQPSTLQFLDPDAVLGNAWADPTVSFCVAGGSPCSSNWNIAAVQGVFGQGFAWPNGSGSGLTLGWMSGVVGAAQLGDGAATGEGTVRNLAALVADATDNIYEGDGTTKGTIKFIEGLDVMEDPCSNGKPVGASTPSGCFGILFDTYFDDELHTRTGLNSAMDGDIAVLAHPLTLKAYNGNHFSVTTYTAALRTTGALALDCGTVCNTLGATGGANAPSGYVGEYISSTLPAGSAVPATTGTPLNVTSISLSAGDWDVTGTLIFTGGTGAISTDTVGWTSTTSATQPTFPNNGGIANLDVTTPSAFGIVMPVGQQRLVLTSTTTVYLGMAANFAGGSASAYGFIGARRAH